MTNKTARYIIEALLGAALLLGCKRETDPLAPVVLTAVLEHADTRTAYDGTQGKLAWTEGDEVAVHVGNSYQTAEITPSDGHLAVSETASAYRNYFAVYPASAADAANYGSPTLKVTLPASYDISDIVSETSAIRTADFSPCPMVAVNDTDDSMLRFRHVGGLLRITLTGVKAATKTVTVTFDKDVTGSYEVHDPASKAPYIETAGTSSGNVVTYTVASSSVGSYTVPVVLNVPVPCGTYNSVTVATLDATGASLASQVYDDEPLEFLRHHGKKLAFGELAFDFVFGSLSDASVEYCGGEGSLSSAFISYKTSDDGATKTAVPFVMEYYWDKDGTGEDWYTTPPSWLAPANIDFSGSTTGQEIAMTVEAQDNSWENPHPGELRNAERAKTDFDLSLVDVSSFNWIGGTPGSVRRTANCYVVQGSGTYKFPLVYGNGVDWTKNTTTGINEDAYRGRAGVGGAYRVDAGIANYLGSFKDHLDGNIYNGGDAQSSPYLTTHLNKDASDFTAVLLWQDAPGLVTVNPTISVEGGIAFLTFSVPAATITQGNALIAVLVDADGDSTPEIAWSWHIWVTDENLARPYGQFGYAPVNVGWCDGEEEHYAGRSCQVAVTQEVSGLRYTATVTQEAMDRIWLGSNPYYQWGRKDPLCAWDAKTQRDKAYYGDKTPTIVKYVGDSPVTLSYAIMNPNQFYASQSSNWFTKRYYNLWNSTVAGQGDVRYGNVAATKTIYDPSPVGYKMPHMRAWMSHVNDPGKNDWWWQGDNSLQPEPNDAIKWYRSGGDDNVDILQGAYWDKDNGDLPYDRDVDLFYPAISARSATSGEILASGIGTLCIVWSANPIDLDGAAGAAYDLTYRFNTTTNQLEVEPNWPSHCSYGEPVRPIKDSF